MSPPGRARKPPEDPPLARILEERPDLLIALTDRLAEILRYPLDAYPAGRPKGSAWERK